MARIRLPARLLLTAALLSAAAGCASRTGDFGRPDPTVTSAFAALPKPGPQFNETDQEAEMHDRIHRFLYAPNVEGWFVVEMTVARRELRPAKVEVELGRYYRWLQQTPFGSSRTRYEAVADDVRSDIDTVPATLMSICTVLDIDRRRGVALAEVGAVEPGMEDRVAARRAENVRAIGRFVAALRFRYESYSYALENLLVETPHEEAVGVDRLLSDLAGYLGAAEAAEFCAATTVPVIVIE